ncbi:MAG: hypothetical protein WAS72_05900 [Saprospiraceae bacterium]
MKIGLTINYSRIPLSKREAVTSLLEANTISAIHQLHDILTLVNAVTGCGSCDVLNSNDIREIFNTWLKKINE